MGIQGVSQVWSDVPEWYLWLEGAPGPFDLALRSVETLEAGDWEMALGRFAIKCYPHASDPVLAAFSEPERRCLDSDRFDQTRTPVFEAKAGIPDPLFTIGTLSIAVDADHTVCLMTYDSLDRLRSRDAGAGETSRINRDVPGWPIGYALFDRLAGLYAFHFKRGPCRFGGGRAPGFETVEHPDGVRECRDSADVSQLSASLMFGDPAAPSPQADALWRSRRDPDEEILFDTAFGDAAPAAEHDPPLPAFPVNPLWWDLASRTARSHLASTCGCGHEHPGRACRHH